eukprot:3249952-Rhodomonas_salina.1
MRVSGYEATGMDKDVHLHPEPEPLTPNSIWCYSPKKDNNIHLNPSSLTRFGAIRQEGTAMFIYLDGYKPLALQYGPAAAVKWVNAIFQVPPTLGPGPTDPRPWTYRP